MQFTGFSFGSVRVDGVTYDHDLIIDDGTIRKRKKAASRKFRGAYGHTPLSAGKDIVRAHPALCREGHRTGTPRYLPRKTFRGDAAGW